LKEVENDFFKLMIQEFCHWENLFSKRGTNLFNMVFNGMFVLIFKKSGKY